MKLGLGLGFNGGSIIYKPVQTGNGAEINTSPAYFNATQGAMILNVPIDNTNTLNGALLSLSDGTLNNLIEVLAPAAAGDRRVFCQVLSGGSTILQHSLGEGSGAPARSNGNYKICATYKNSEISFYINGFLIAKYTGASLPTLSQIGIGSRTNSTLATQYTIGDWEYYDKFLPKQVAESKTRQIVAANSLTFDSALNIVMFMGQSNSSGRATANPTYTNLVASRRLLANDLTVKDYADPYDDDASSLYPYNDDANAGGSYAGVVIDGLVTSEGGKWCALPTNKGATPVDGTFNGWAYNLDQGSSQFESGSVSYTGYQKALIALKAGNVRALVWHQGESNALSGTTETNFKTATKNILEYYRSILNCPIIIVGLHKWVTGSGMGAEADWNNIQAWQEEIAGEYDYMSFVDLSDIEGAPGNGDVAGVKIHLDLAANQTAGGRIATAIANAL